MSKCLENFEAVFLKKYFEMFRRFKEFLKRYLGQTLEFICLSLICMDVKRPSQIGSGKDYRDQFQ